MWSQLGGTLPAPLFLFLAGISFALLTDRLMQQELSASRIAGTMIRRGAEIFALGILFRLQEYVIAWGWAPWSDLLRVDILNTIGVSMMLMGIACWAVLASGSREPKALIAAAVGAAGAIVMLTPMVWTRWQPGWLPWPVESYINGVHNLGAPQAWLFPVFPWSAFAFVGLATGFGLRSNRLLGREWMFIPAGVALFGLSRGIDALRFRLYPVYDYWHTSPSFFVLRVGLLFLVLGIAYTWNRWGAGMRGFSPLIQLGQTSLLVYWVHIEFVYGRVSILRKHAQSIGTATLGLATIFLMMLGLSLLRTRWKRRGAGLLPTLRTPVKAWSGDAQAPRP